MSSNISEEKKLQKFQIEYQPNLYIQWKFK